ncbi:MAG TPA: hypothetical protein VFW00_01320 [Rhodocyclaceae bacterium]|nr:hypothetical protein [Rhodocyclaceae bacterium]
MELIVDNTITYEDDPLDCARETLLRYKRGEIRAYAFRIFMQDGSYEDLVDGWTEEDKEKARADMLKRFELSPMGDVPLPSAPATLSKVFTLFSKKSSVQIDVSNMPLKRRFGS